MPRSGRSLRCTERASASLLNGYVGRRTGHRSNASADAARPARDQPERDDPEHEARSGAPIPSPRQRAEGQPLVVGPAIEDPVDQNRAADDRGRQAEPGEQTSDAAANGSRRKRRGSRNGSAGSRSHGDRRDGCRDRDRCERDSHRGRVEAASRRSCRVGSARPVLPPSAAVNNAAPTRSTPARRRSIPSQAAAHPVSKATRASAVT